MKQLNGLYNVNGVLTENKIHAIIESSRTGSEIKWHYFDEIFSRAVKNTKNNIPLIELYKQRAQQLRDSYDYLILNYSGGADSHNILQTFLINDIKLDLIYVQWPEQLMDKGLYIPNAIDKSNSNFHSEWDLVIKKDLEWIAKNKPEIKIEIGDWTKTVNEKFYNDNLFLSNVSNLPSIARAQKQNTFSIYETLWSNRGKKVGSIFGVDKTSIVKKTDNWYFYFCDTAFMTQANPENPNGVEYFYHSPLFPEIAVIQAQMLVEWYKKNPNKQYLIKSRSERELDDPLYRIQPWAKHYTEFAEISEIFKLVCYPHWNFDRFQADKPFSVLEGFKMGVRAWDNILTVLPNFDRVQKKWEYNWKSYLNLINPSLMRSNDTFSVITSKWHLIS